MVSTAPEFKMGQEELAWAGNNVHWLMTLFRIWRLHRVVVDVDNGSRASCLIRGVFLSYTNRIYPHPVFVHSMTMMITSHTPKRLSRGWRKNWAPYWLRLFNTAPTSRHWEKWIKAEKSRGLCAALSGLILMMQAFPLFLCKLTD